MYTNDVQFEIITDQIWRVPKRNLFLNFLNIFKHYYEHPEPFIPVKLAIKVTNNTDTPTRINFHQFLVLELANSSGKVPFDGFCIRPASGSVKDFPLLKMGEAAIFLLDSVIFWNWKEGFGLHIIANDGFFWFIQPLRFGTYNLSFTYSNQQPTIRVREDGTNVKLNKFWLGQVAIPIVEISVTNS